MLKKFNNLIYKNFIMEQTEDLSSNGIIESRIKGFLGNTFFVKYILPAAERAGVLATKQNNCRNRFLVQGTIENLITFFNNFKVDAQWCEDPNEFKIFTPMFTFTNINNFRQLNLSEFYPREHHQAYGIYTTHEIENITELALDGIWYSPFDEDDAAKKCIKGLKPSEVEKKILNPLMKNIDDKMAKEVGVAFEFQVETDEGRFSQIWDEITEYAKNPDEMNALHNQNPDDFDYTQLNVKQINDEALVKGAVKNIQRTTKDFTKSQK